jgi:hypothetical protein
VVTAVFCSKRDAEENPFFRRINTNGDGENICGYSHAQPESPMRERVFLKINTPKGSGLTIC